MGQTSETDKRSLTIGFDADDTLWQNEPYYQAAADKLVDLLRTYQDPARIGQVLAETEIRNVGWYGVGIKSYTLSMIETAVAASGGKVAGAEIGVILELGREMLRTDMVLFEHAARTLAYLAAGHELMLITKGDLMEQGSKVTRSGLAHLFKTIEIVQEKTPETYQRLLDQYKIPASRFIMVGNSLKSDILPVIEIGSRAVFIPYQNTWVQEHVDPPHHDYFEIEHLGMLPELIAGIESGSMNG